MLRLRLHVPGFEFRVPGFLVVGFKISGLGSTISGSGSTISGFTIFGLVGVLGGVRAGHTLLGLDRNGRNQHWPLVLGSEFRVGVCGLGFVV